MIVAIFGEEVQTLSDVHSELMPFFSLHREILVSPKLLSEELLNKLEYFCRFSPECYKLTSAKFMLFLAFLVTNPFHFPMQHGIEWAPACRRCYYSQL
jgi:hypothetical protein